MYLSVSITAFECPCAVSKVKISTPSETKASILFIDSLLVLTAAPTRRLPFESLDALG